MASSPATHQNEENKLLTQIEEPIASRLRSSCRIRDAQTSDTGEIDVNNQSEYKPSLLSRKQEGKTKSKNSVAKESEVHTVSTNKTGQSSTHNHKGSEVHTAKKSNIGPTPKGNEVHISSSCTRRLPSKDSSETKRKEQDLKNQHANKSKASKPQSETKACSTSKNSKGPELEKIKSSAPKKSNTGEPSCSHLAKEKEKTRPSVKFNMKSIKEHPVYHIRWKGFRETSTRHNCSLCDKDIAYSPNEEKWKYPIHEENELEYSIYSSMVEEQRQCAILPEVVILPCSHVFHSTCLSETLMQHRDPPCPICNMF